MGLEKYWKGRGGVFCCEEIGEVSLWWRERGKDRGLVNRAGLVVEWWEEGSGLYAIDTGRFDLIDLGVGSIWFVG